MDHQFHQEDQEDGFQLDDRSEPPPPPPPPSLASTTASLQSVLKSVPSCNSSSREKAHLLFRLTFLIENDYAEELKALLEEEGANPNVTLSFGVPILLKAVRCLSMRVIDLLLESGADPLPSIRYLMWPQAFAAIPQCVDLLKKLLPYLEKGVLRHTEGKNLLYRSTSCPDLSIFEYLVNQGVSFSQHDVEILIRLVQHPDHTESLRMIKKVLDLSGHHITIQGSVGFGLLKQSLISKKKEVFQFFLKKGADPYFKSQTGLTLMHHSCCDPDLILFLYDVGLDVNATNQWGLKPCEDNLYLSLESLVTLVVLGQQLNHRQMVELETHSEDFALLNGMIKKGDFQPLNLKMLCRKYIRHALWVKDYQSIEKSIHKLPLPKPVQLFLDVKSFCELVMGQSQ